MRRICGSLLLILAAAMPGLAAGPYSYQLIVSPFYNAPGGPLLNFWFAVWQSNSLVKPTACPGVNLAKEKDFAILGAPLPAYKFSSTFGLDFCSDTPAVPPEIGIEWDSKTAAISEIFYTLHFSAAKPPTAPGVFTTTDALIQYAAGYQPGPPATLIITDLSTAPAPPPPPANPPSHPVSAWTLATIRASLEIAGPVTPAPGSPVEAIVGFTDLNGNLIGPLTPIPVSAGQVASVDLNAATFLQGGQHANVIPVIQGPQGVQLPAVQLTVEVFDRQNGAMLSSGNGFDARPSSLAPQGLAGGQTLRLLAAAYPPNPCAATLGFADMLGNAVGPTLEVTMNPGQAKSLDLTGSMLNLAAGQRVEVQPSVTLQPAPNAAAAGGSACSITSEVFDQVTGRTWTYQVAEIR